MANNQNDCLDWDDEIEDDGKGSVILPEGDYNFVVSDFERGRFPGGPKLPPCNKAALTLKVETDNGTAYVHTDLMLHKSVEWKLSSFFRCIGQKKHGEKLVMNWNRVKGAEGRAHFKPRTYTDSNGNERQANDLDRFYDYDEKNFPERGFINVPESDSDDIPFD